MNNKGNRKDIIDNRIYELSDGNNPSISYQQAPQARPAQPLHPLDRPIDLEVQRFRAVHRVCKWGLPVP